MIFVHNSWSVSHQYLLLSFVWETFECTLKQDTLVEKTTYVHPVRFTYLSAARFTPHNLINWCLPFFEVFKVFQIHLQTFPLLAILMANLAKFCNVAKFSHRAEPIYSKQRQGSYNDEACKYVILLPSIIYLFIVYDDFLLQQ